MIDYIVGVIDSVQDGSVVVEANSIGYMLNVSTTTITELANAEDQTKLYTYLNVNDNGINLYGFSAKAEREVFLKLISVSKVGPKVALSILSQYTPSEVISAVVSNNAKALTNANGVGKKLAENIVFNLKDKFEDFESEEFSMNSIDIFENDPQNEAISALVGLGFERSYSTKLIKTVYDENATCEELISRSLKMIGK